MCSTEQDNSLSEGEKKILIIQAGVYFEKIYASTTRKDRVNNVLVLINYVIENNLWFFNESEFPRFKNVVRQKLVQFRKETLGNEEEKELRDKCDKILDEYFFERCRAYTKLGERCKKYPQKNGTALCWNHRKFKKTIYKNLLFQFPDDLAKLCFNKVF